MQNLQRNLDNLYLQISKFRKDKSEIYADKINKKLNADLDNYKRDIRIAISELRVEQIMGKK